MSRSDGATRSPTVDTVGDRERVMAGTDCGFGTIVGDTQVSEDVVCVRPRRAPTRQPSVGNCAEAAHCNCAYSADKLTTMMWEASKTRGSSDDRFQSRRLRDRKG